MSRPDYTLLVSQKPFLPYSFYTLVTRMKNCRMDLEFRVIWSNIRVQEAEGSKKYGFN